MAIKVYPDIIRWQNIFIRSLCSFLDSNLYQKVQGHASSIQKDQSDCQLWENNLKSGNKNDQKKLFNNSSKFIFEIGGIKI